MPCIFLKESFELLTKFQKQKQVSKNFFYFIIFIIIYSDFHRVEAQMIRREVFHFTTIDFIREGSSTLLGFRDI